MYPVIGSKLERALHDPFKVFITIISETSDYNIRKIVINIPTWQELSQQHHCLCKSDSKLGLRMRKC